eukprot:TRINITY_DN4685_c0_g2_i1.p2 TRINITY_DN4685_c0_g2~~TRINITY_DN4685_c0_g2_i1.p2  ORF type:complete len:323 (+),score=25.81 TRINITY_DN4685_c0_g2_i1:78-971(+)
MQDGAYYVGRLELLQWINQSLALNINKIEQTATGAVACQLLDSLHPGVIPMGKVDFNCKNEYEYIQNWKVLQSAFNKLNINKDIDINKLIKGRPLDNMEFLQWFKHYYDTQAAIAGLPEYDPIARREFSKSGKVRDGGSKISSSTTTASKRMATRKTTVKSVLGPTMQKRPPSAGSDNPVSSNKAKPDARENVETTELQQKMRELNEELDELKKQKIEAEDETNFYYEKLRAVEVVCQEIGQDSIPIIGLITRLLYAKDLEEHKQILQQWQMSRDSENNPPNQEYNIQQDFDQDLQL